MKTFQTEYHHVFESRDFRGKFQFRIHKDLSQIQIETEMDDDFGEDMYLDIDRDELIAIRDLLTKVIGDKTK